MIRAAAPVALILGLILATLATDRPRPRADFTFINRGDVSTLDLPTMSWLQDFRVARCLWEGLTSPDVFSHDCTPTPAASASWDISPDGRVYTFRLRRDARWSNGRPVLASHFVYGWRRVLLPDSGSDYVRMLHLIKGAGEFTAWRARALEEFRAGPGGADAARDLWARTLARFDDLVAVSTPDDFTLRVELVRPTPYFLDLLSFPPFFPALPEHVDAYATLDPRTGMLRVSPESTRAGALVTNGPFMLVEWRFKRELRLERNPHYWNQAALALDSISIPTVDDPNAQVLAFLSGSAQWVSDVTPAYRAEMIAAKRRFHDEHRAEVDAMRAAGLDPVEIDRRLPPDPRNRIHVFPTFGTYFYNFNCLPTLRDGRANPFADPRVRRAFSMAVDKDALVRDVRRCGEPAARTLIPPGSIAGYASPGGLAFDPAGARALLAEAGYPGGRGLPTIEIVFNKDGGHDVIAQAVAKDWERHLGVRTLLAQKEIKVFREQVKSGDFMVCRAAWFGDYGDPTTFLDLNRTGDGNNDRKYSSARYDGLLARAADETDPAARLALLTEAERIITDEDAPLLPLYHYVQIYLFDPHRIAGISPHPRQTQLMHLVDVLGDGKGPERARAMPPRLPLLPPPPRPARAGSPTEHAAP